MPRTWKGVSASSRPGLTSGSVRRSIPIGHSGQKARTDMADNTAVIFGISGIGGRALADRLQAAGGWRVVGVSRHRPPDLPAIEHAACDLTDEASTREALASITPATHLFFVTWSR